MLVELVASPLLMPLGPPRSEGVHLSKIIRNMAVENGVLKPEWVEDFSLIEAKTDQEEWWDNLDEPSRLRMSIGLAWEQWYLPQLGNVVHQPGEMCLQGIYMTHDGESLDMILTPKGQRLKLFLHEVKATYKSTKTVGDDLATQWLWLAQTKGYCKGLNILVAYLHVLFLCGDYKYPIKPQKKVFKITYTQLEIDDNWEMILSYLHHSQLMEAEAAMKDTV